MLLAIYFCRSFSCATVDCNAALVQEADPYNHADSTETKTTFDRRDLVGFGALIQARVETRVDRE